MMEDTYEDESSSMIDNFIDMMTNLDNMGSIFDSGPMPSPSLSSSTDSIIDMERSESINNSSNCINSIDFNAYSPELITGTQNCPPFVPSSFDIDEFIMTNGNSDNCVEIMATDEDNQIGNSHSSFSFTDTSPENYFSLPLARDSTNVTDIINVQCNSDSMNVKAEEDNSEEDKQISNHDINSAAPRQQHNRHRRCKRVRRESNSSHSDDRNGDLIDSVETEERAPFSRHRKDGRRSTSSSEDVTPTDSIPTCVSKKGAEVILRAALSNDATEVFQMSQQDKNALMQHGMKALPYDKRHEDVLYIIQTFRRKLKNTDSAKKSRLRQKHHVEELQHKIDHLTKENADIAERAATTEESNQSLLAQLRSLKQIIANPLAFLSDPSGLDRAKKAGDGVGATLLVLLLSFSLFVAPFSAISSASPEISFLKDFNYHGSPFMGSDSYSDVNQESLNVRNDKTDSINFVNFGKLLLDGDDDYGDDDDVNKNQAASNSSVPFVLDHLLLTDENPSESRMGGVVL